MRPLDPFPFAGKRRRLEMIKNFAIGIVLYFWDKPELIAHLLFEILHPIGWL